MLTKNNLNTILVAYELLRQAVAMEDEEATNAYALALATEIPGLVGMAEALIDLVGEVDDRIH